jgi:hypothetical protein
VREEKVSALRDEFYEYGELINTLDLIDKLRTIISIIKRHDCTIEEMYEGLKGGASKFILNHNYRIPPKTIM